jgi:hypothetical protein
MGRGNWPEFRDGAAFADHKDVLPGLYAVEHRGGVVGKFSKADGAHDINGRLSPLVYVFGSILTQYRNHFGKPGVNSGLLWRVYICTVSRQAPQRGTNVVPRGGILPPMVAELPIAGFVASSSARAAQAPRDRHPGEHRPGALVSEPAFLKNAYRVLLTRARQGMVIFVPPVAKRDRTRSPAFYDGVTQYLTDLGVPQV